MINFHLFSHCLKYFLFSRHKYAYGIHSPFLYHLIRKCFLAKDRDYVLKDVEVLYKTMKKDKNEIKIYDLGAGSKKMKGEKRRITDIAKYSVMPLKYRVLLRKLVKYFKPKNVLELGTSLGITSLYLTYDIDTHLVTIEGCKSIAEIAQKNFDIFRKKAKIDLRNDSFDEFIDKNEKLFFDMIILDGNHTYEATLRYFEKLLSKNGKQEQIFIIDDIYWSKNMTRAWEKIKQNPRITLTLDLCRLGIAFTSTKLSKQNFVIRY